MSKGSWYRRVDKKKYDENFDKIFGPPKKEQPDHHDECVFGKTCCDNRCDVCLVGEVIKETKLL